MKNNISPFEDWRVHKNINYVSSKGLEAAIKVALELGMPLLVTGEPGTGKSMLAPYVTQMLGGDPEQDLLVFNAKTTSLAKDLLYQYDALGHFRNSRNGKQEISVMDYISFNSLGKAIIESSEKRQVVLIDEIDKAPRDFPNDVLFEFERLAFKIDEVPLEALKKWNTQNGEKLSINDQGFVHVAPLADNKTNRPILILTSNSEKSLPEAFLRRCIYYNIRFPSSKKLFEIVKKNVNISPEFEERMLEAAVLHFQHLRDKRGLKKKPATAELLAWIHVIDQQNININSDDPKELEKLAMSYSILAKTKEDLNQLSKNVELDT